MRNIQDVISPKAYSFYLSGDIKEYIRYPNSKFCSVPRDAYNSLKEARDLNPKKYAGVTNEHLIAIVFSAVYPHGSFRNLSKLGCDPFHGDGISDRKDEDMLNMLNKLAASPQEQLEENLSMQNEIQKRLDELSAKMTELKNQEAVLKEEDIDKSDMYGSCTVS